ncbi:uncharacterized protein B0H18DRAFT_1115135 [Fomitopsis serialis]|uniref:uncharacterized protein n=1 Tax=Fomitopsis serialis TaxID=139415 RepID=UPI0020089BD5|nr:uncharacterized protein B0H18DRAFT_1115135 [Neoantrodia serialis]KAH9933753.1 hypothetical protein B0H18DRAFT_1115135 [Neoantrodia serialis]
MRHRDCEIAITCDGKRLEEYNVQVEGNVAECYIASESDKVFEIKCSNHFSTYFSVQTTVDGQQFPRRLSVKAGFKNETLECADGDGFKPLMFSRICVTDDDNAPRKSSYADSLGLIEIRVVRATIEKAVPWTPPPGPGPKAIGPIHETMKKGGMHCVSFGATQRHKNIPELVVPSYIDQWSAPYIIFKIRYKPLVILQAQGIVEPAVDQSRRAGPSRNSPVVSNPLSPEREAANGARRRDAHDASDSDRPRKRARKDGSSASPSSSKGEGDDGDDNLTALQAQMRAIRRKITKAQIRKIQRDQSTGIKREESPIDAGEFHGGVIDLTED